MCDIYRIVECRKGLFQQIAFVASSESAKTYLQTCYDITKNEPDVFYLAIKIQIEQ